MKNNHSVHIIGAGLAGSEAAWMIAQNGIKVHLYEMRPHKSSPAHKTDLFAELVCSNSFRSDNPLENAVGLLHEEMRLLNSLIMKTAAKHKVPAGSALAVDRENFSLEITSAIKEHPLIQIHNREITDLQEFKDKCLIIATGPLTSDNLALSIREFTNKDQLSFYDAIAPIIYKNSINMDICWYQSRYDKVGSIGNGKDYINCPLDKEQYYQFVEALRSGEKIEFKEFEKINYFEGCLPIEIMAERGLETLRHGPMKPRGLTNAHQRDIKPYAVVQLRQDNHLGSLYNMVGFQTKLKYKDQIEAIRKIPGLENAKFARLGGIHRNTFLNSPYLLDKTLRLKNHPFIRFAGQITGCEGYVESAAIGLLSGIFAIKEIQNKPLNLPPLTTAFGALLNHITQGHYSHDDQREKNLFQPMNINFGLLPELETSLPKSNEKKNQKEKGRLKKRLICERALKHIKEWINQLDIKK